MPSLWSCPCANSVTARTGPMPAWAGPVWYGCRTGPVLPPVGPARPDDLVGPGRHRSPGTPRRSALPSPPPLACISTSPAHPTRNRSRPISPLLAPDLHRRINSAPYAIVRRASAAPGTRTPTIYGVRLRGGTCRGPDGSHSDFGLSNSTSSHRHTIPQARAPDASDGAGPTNHYAALLLGIQMGSESPRQPEFFTEQGSSVI